MYSLGLRLSERAIRRAHHVGVVEPLHQAIGPGEPALDPHHLELGKALGQPVDHPVGHVDHVEPHEAERMHRDETVGQRQRLVVPVVGGMEGDRLAHLLEQRIGLHVGVVVHRLVARRGHHESDHALLVAEILHGLVGGFGIVERQIEHRDDARLVRRERARRARRCRPGTSPPRPRPADAGRGTASASGTGRNNRRPWRPSIPASCRRRGDAVRRAFVPTDVVPAQLSGA